MFGNAEGRFVHMLLQVSRSQPAAGFALLVATAARAFCKRLIILIVLVLADDSAWSSDGSQCMEAFRYLTSLGLKLSGEAA